MGRCAERWQYGDGEGSLLATYEPSDPLYSVEGAALSLDGSLLTVAGNYVIFFDAASGERLVTWGPTDGAEGVAVRAVGFSPDGQVLWAIDERGVLRLRAVLEGNVDNLSRHTYTALHSQNLQSSTRCSVTRVANVVTVDRSPGQRPAPALHRTFG